MNQSVSALGNAVREIRTSKHLTQEALAEQVGVCKRTIIDIEKSTGNPKFEVLCTLVRALDLPLYRVFYPEIEENQELKNQILHEVSGCSEYEMKIILSMVRSIRQTTREANETVNAETIS